MRAFEFSLERIRNYKVQILDREKKTLSSLKRRRDELAGKISALELFRDEKIAQMAQRQSEGVSMGELVPLSFLIENARKQMEALQIELNKADEIVEAQRKVVLAIYQEKTGMDKLEEKQAEEYRLLEAKAGENEITQAITNTLARKNYA